MKTKRNLVQTCLLAAALLSPAVVRAQFTFTTNNGAITITGYTGNSVTNIGNNAFESCTSLTNLVVGSQVAGVGVSAFQSCIRLPGVTFQDKLTSIEDLAFWGCNNLTNVMVGNNIVRIG